MKKTLQNTQDWRQNHISSVLRPHRVMTGDRFSHLCDPEEEKPGHDKPFRVRPLCDDILSACRAYYHPTRELAKGKDWHDTVYERPADYREGEVFYIN